MTQTRFKKVPFDIELAKKITKGEMKGRIVTHKGKNARIVCWDKKRNSIDSVDYPIVVIAENDYDGELLYTCTKEGLASYPNYKNRYNLILEIPTYHKDYSNFVPQKNQTCLVRDYAHPKWSVAVCTGKYKSTGKILFYNEYGGTYTWGQTLPLTKVTKWLIGTNKSYEQLCEELDKKWKRNCKTYRPTAMVGRLKQRTWENENTLSLKYFGTTQKKSQSPIDLFS